MASPSSPDPVARDAGSVVAETTEAGRSAGSRDTESASPASWARVWTCLASAVLSAVGLLALIWSHRQPLQELATRDLTVESKVVPELERWAARAHDVGVRRLALFGDSVLSCGSTDLGQSLTKALARRGIRSDLVKVGHVAFRAPQFYYLLGPTLRGHPDTAIIEINPRAFGEAYRLGTRGNLNASSRWLTWLEALALGKELESDGLQPLDPLVYRVEARFDLLHVFDGLRERATQVLSDWAGALEAALHVSKAPPHTPFDEVSQIQWDGPTLRVSLTAAGARTNYGAEWSSSPMVPVLRAMLQQLRQAGVRVVAYVTPLNVQRIAELGLDDELALGAKTDRLGRSLGLSATEWIDLHDLLPAERFRDHSEHLDATGCTLVSAALLDALVASPDDDAAPVRTGSR
ncbi:hypothetical protein K2Z84_26600 [Candidatus Binatia bacterium]|nr:hypothetical protein [Candidatus Binatia bacterium]